MNTNFPFQKILIIGLGLIGGSLARALTAAQTDCEIIAYDRNRASTDLALQQGYIDRASYCLANSICEADLIIWALPIKAICTGLAQYASCFREGQIVTDVGSSKRAVLQAAEVLPKRTFFIGGHPMAGKETSGLEQSDPKLFTNRPWVLVPSNESDQAHVNKLARLVSATGAHPVQMSAAEHDKAAALLSHLPQLVSSSLMNTIGDLVGELPSKYTLAAGGFVDTTRIAGSNSEMWRDVCLANRDELLRLLDIYVSWLMSIRNSLAAQDSDGIHNFLQSARSKKEGIQTGHATV